MALPPLEQFYCDTCGKVIEKISEGWLEWKRPKDRERVRSGFQIVHQLGGCGYNEKEVYAREHILLGNNHLSRFVGSDGLAYLLHVGMKEELGDYKEFLEIVRRLHVPFYEEARLYKDQAAADELDSIGHALPAGLQTIAQKYGSGATIFGAPEDPARKSW